MIKNIGASERSVWTAFRSPFFYAAAFVSTDSLYCSLINHACPLALGRSPSIAFGGAKRMDAKVLEKVDKAWAEGERPRHTDADRWTLRLSPGSVVLANGSVLTAHGQRLKDLGLWEDPDADFITYPREYAGKCEYVTLKSGKRVNVRVWEDGGWKYTARGREYFKHHPINYVFFEPRMRGRSA